MADKSENRSYCLIRGVFDPDDAMQLLMTLIDDKISFHRLSNWSRRERFGEADTAGLKRVDELKQTKAELSALLAEARAAGRDLTIKCNIDITLEP